MKFKTAILIACGCGWIQGSGIEPKNVLVLVNESDHESIDLGYYYALKRDVPVENVIHLSVPAEEESISWDVYLERLYNPLMSRLLEAGWLEGFDSSRADAIGRGIRLIDAHRIEALVVCKGIPLRILDDATRLPPREAYPKDKLKFLNNRGSVDSELALLPFPGANIDAFFPNPLYRRTEPANLFDLKPLVVGRLDGPGYDLARELINNALKAEEEGIAGRAYVDMGGPHEMADQWLEAVVETLTQKGFDLQTHPGPDRFNLVDRFDEPLFYFGWYSGSIDGPFTHYDFKFPVGAIALHIHSFTASSIRHGHTHWVGPLVARGVTATFGNTFEPFLYLTHQPHFLMEGLFKGLTMGEAALYSLPALSWASVFIGDPLYKPPLSLGVSPKNEYDVLRTANMARSRGDTSAYKAVLAEHRQNGHYSTGLWLYQYFREQGKSDQAYQQLDTIQRPSAEDTKYWGVLLELGEAYLQLGDSQAAITIVDDLLGRSQTSRELRLQLLKRAIQLASNHMLTTELARWQSQLDTLTVQEASAEATR